MVDQHDLSDVSLLIKHAQDWLTQDPDPVTRQQLSELIRRAPQDSSALAELNDAFRAPLEFGTAGLRGKLGAGPNRMNRVVVAQAASGLASYLHHNGFSGQAVAIGFDGRHNSEIFARDTARIFAGAGFAPMLFSHVVPTPLLAFAVRELKTCAGIMVTASHNPPQDNGYKVYLGDGRQIVSPADAEISQHIRAVTNISSLPLSDECTYVPNDIRERYLASLHEAIHEGPTRASERGEVISVYTAMHGVGWNTLREACVSSDFKEPIAVVEQRDPDPDFPTVAFPNPEEVGALDLAIAQANLHNADILIANDPDADRLAVALPKGNGEWKTLHGDQVGVLLAWWVTERAKQTGHTLDGTFASSIVSSMLLEQMAHAAGLNYSVTLTGFKWVSRVPNLIFGYEEALGYCVNPKYVSDKDGISAATFILEMVAALKSKNRTLWDVLDEITEQFGLYSSDQISVKVTSVEQVHQVMAALRTSPPQSLGGLSVSQVRDLAVATPELPATDGVMIMLQGQGDIEKARVIVRPSGTEPKIKCYLEVVNLSKDISKAQASNTEALAALASAAKPLLT